MTRWWFVVLLVLVFGIAIGIGIGYEMKKPNHIQVSVGGLGQQALLNPQPGDLVVWRNGLEHVAPNWVFGASPCDANYPNSTYDCHISASADKKWYAYHCPDSSPCDPEVPIGSDIIVTGSQNKDPIRAAALHRVEIGCDPTHNNGVNVTENPAVVKIAEGGVYWLGLGNVTAWNIVWKDGGSSPPLCKEAAINQAQPKCTFSDSSVAGKTYTYTVTASACATPSGDFQVQVNP